MYRRLASDESRTKYTTAPAIPYSATAFLSHDGVLPAILTGSPLVVEMPRTTTLRRRLAVLLSTTHDQHLPVSHYSRLRPPWLSVSLSTERRSNKALSSRRGSVLGRVWRGCRCGTGLQGWCCATVWAGIRMEGVLLRTSCLDCTVAFRKGLQEGREDV